MYSEYDLQDYWWYQDGKTISGSRKKLYKNSGGLANLYKASYSTLKASGGDDIICVNTKKRSCRCSMRRRQRLRHELQWQRLLLVLRRNRR